MKKRMKKDYEKPIVEVVEFEYNVQAETSTEGTEDVSGWWL